MLSYQGEWESGRVIIAEEPLSLEAIMLILLVQAMNDKTPPPQLNCRPYMPFSCCMFH